MDNSKKMASVGISIVMLLVGGAAGFGISKATSNNDDSTSSSMMQRPTSETKAADLRASLVTLGVEHMQLTNQAVDGALDSSPNASETGAALYKNGTDIGAAVGSIYGKDAEATFNSVWKLHLDQFVNYAVASSKGDEMAKKAALEAIDSGYTKPLAQYLAKANPNINEGNLEAALRHHIEVTATMIDKHVEKDFAEESKQLSEASEHIESIFSSLAGAIVKQYPDKF